MVAAWCAAILFLCRVTLSSLLRFSSSCIWRFWLIDSDGTRWTPNWQWGWFFFMWWIVLGWPFGVDVKCNGNWDVHSSRILLLLSGVEHCHLHFGSPNYPPDALIQSLAVCPMVFRLWQIVSIDCSSVVDTAKEFISSPNTNVFQWRISPELGSWIVHALILWALSTQFVTSWFTIQLTPLAPSPCPLPKLLPGPPYWVAEVILPALMLKVVQCRCPDINSPYMLLPQQIQSIRALDKGFYFLSSRHITAGNCFPLNKPYAQCTSLF